MAIIVGREESRINWFAVALALFIISFIGASVYFLFFIDPPYIERIAPINLDNVNQLSSAKIDPNTVLQNPSFLLLKKYIPDPDTGKLGRANPFLPI